MSAVSQNGLSRDQRLRRGPHEDAGPEFPVARNVRSARDSLEASRVSESSRSFREDFGVPDDRSQNSNGTIPPLLASLDMFFDTGDSLQAALAAEAETMAPSDDSRTASTIPSKRRSPDSRLPPITCLEGAQALATTGSPILETISLEPLPRSTCNICCRSFQSLEALDQHAKTAFHRIYVCPTHGCGKSYYRRDVYIRHKSDHRQDSFHVCYLCSQDGKQRVFTRKDHLTQHQRNCHGGTDSATKYWNMVEDLPGDYNLLQFPYDDPAFDDAHPQVYNISAASPRDITGINATQVDSSRPAQEGGSYQSSTIKEFENALESVVGRNSPELRILKEALDLNDRSTPEQLARKLQKLFVQNGGIQHSELESSRRPSKRRAPA